MLRREIERLRKENAQLRAAAGSGAANQPAPSQQPPPDAYVSDPYGPALPPLRSLSGNLPNVSDSMTGVQYEGQRPSGFRQERF